MAKRNKKEKAAGREKHEQLKSLAEKIKEDFRRFN
jgi:hypothetical protein